MTQQPPLKNLKRAQHPLLSRKMILNGHFIAVLLFHESRGEVRPWQRDLKKLVIQLD